VRERESSKLFIEKRKRGELLTREGQLDPQPYWPLNFSYRLEPRNFLVYLVHVYSTLVKKCTHKKISQTTDEL
jgi:hypothetical protein